MSVDEEVQRFLVQPFPSAFRTDGPAEKLAAPLFRGGSRIFLKLHFQIFGEPLIGKRISRRKSLVVEAQPFVGSVDDVVDRLLRDILDGSFQCAAVFLAYRVYLMENHRVAETA